MRARTQYQKCLNVFLVTSLLFVLLGAIVPSTALAKSSCSSNTSLDESIDCLKARHDAIANELKYTSDIAFGENSKLGKRANPERLQHFNNSRSNGERAKVKNSKERFKKLAKDETRANGKNAGHLVPFSDADDENNDGVCDYEQKDMPKYLTADCASIEQLDGEVQICNPKKKNKGKSNSSRQELAGLECDRSFDSQEAVTEEERVDMIATIEQMEDVYNAVEDDLILMNDHLDIVNANLPDENVVLAASADACVMPAPTEGLSEAVSVLRGLTAAAQGASAIMDSASGQTVVVFGTGGNGRAAAVILNSAALAAELAYITVDEILSAETSALQTATMECIAEVAADVAAMRVEMLQQHNEIKAQLEATRVELVEILNTPHGQRDQFPRK